MDQINKIQLIRLLSNYKQLGINELQLTYCKIAVFDDISTHKEGLSNVPEVSCLCNQKSAKQ